MFVCIIVAGSLVSLSQDWSMSCVEQTDGRRSMRMSGADIGNAAGAESQQLSQLEIRVPRACHSAFGAFDCRYFASALRPRHVHDRKRHEPICHDSVRQKGGAVLGAG